MCTPTQQDGPCRCCVILGCLTGKLFNTHLAEEEFTEFLEFSWDMFVKSVFLTAR